MLSFRVSIIRSGFEVRMEHVAVAHAERLDIGISHGGQVVLRLLYCPLVSGLDGALIRYLWET